MATVYFVTDLFVDKEQTFSLKFFSENDLEVLCWKNERRIFVPWHRVSYVEKGGL